MKKVFTTGQVAKICKVAPRTVAKWFDAGRLRGYRIPGSQDRRIPREQLIRFLTEHSMPLGNLAEEEQHRVLLVGCDDRTAAHAREHLPESAGFRFEAAATTFQAGMLAVSFRPDSIVIDFGIGRGDASGLVTRLRQIENYSATLILAVAGEDEADADGLRGYGFDVVFKRPFDVALLAERVRSLAVAKWDA